MWISFVLQKALSEFELERAYDNEGNLIFILGDYYRFSWDSLQESLVWACGSKIPSNLNELLDQPIDELFTWIETVLEVKKKENESNSNSSSSSNVSGRKFEPDSDGNLVEVS